MTTNFNFLIQLEEKKQYTIKFQLNPEGRFRLSKLQSLINFPPITKDNKVKKGQSGKMQRKNLDGMGIKKVLGQERKRGILNKSDLSVNTFRLESLNPDNEKVKV